MLDKKLEEYAASDAYPFHMPGHKRQPLEFPNPYTIDITEINGFDDMHEPEGEILELMEEMARLYHSEKSYLLVNGSTSGNISAIFAATKRGDEIAVARNCHKSVYNAIKLRELRAHYLYPTVIENQLQGEIQPEEVEKMLKEYPAIKAVVLTSPTYEGIVSNIDKIVEISHAAKASVIVDCAHGAHFGFHPSFPKSPVEAKADAVIMSLHKTLPAFTQTAVLHYNDSGLMNKENLEEYLGTFQTSSPSYLFMASIGKCIRFLKEHPESFEEYNEKLHHFYENTSGLKHLQIYQRPGMDPGKIIILTGDSGLTGEELSEILRRQYHLEMEMASFTYVLAMTSIMDTKEGMQRLEVAVREIDDHVDKYPINEGAKLINTPLLYQPQEKKYEIYEIEDMEIEKVIIEKSISKVSAKSISLYPPGIPLIIPGEVITREVVDTILLAQNEGLKVTGIAVNSNDKTMVTIVKS